MANSLFGLSSFFHRAIDSAQSPMEKKRIIMAVNLGVIQVFLCVGLFLFSAIVSTDSSTFFFGPILLVATLVSLFIGRQGMHRIALMVDLLSLNILLFFLSQRLGSQSGINYFYASTAAATLALYGYEDWKTGVSLTLLSMVLFMATLVMRLEFIPVKSISPENLRLFLLINSCLTYLISIYCVVMILKLNYESERGLLENKSLIEQQNAELKKANTELDRFVYSASHDLRAPLSTISGLINVIELEAKGRDIAYLPLIRDRVKTMDKFIKDIIDYSRNTRLETDLTEVNLFDLLQEVKESLDYFDDASRVKIMINVSPELVIHSDVDRLKVVLNNLITNAIKYADFGKECPQVEIAASLDNGMIVLEVKDNGIGISEAHKEKVFNMFYRATENSKGSGLGLYIARESIVKLGGKISLWSTVGKGSIFKIELPA